MDMALPSELHTNSNLCLVAHIVNVDNDEEVLSDSGAPCTAGTIVQSPHRLRDLSGIVMNAHDARSPPVTSGSSFANRAGWTSGPLAKVATTPFRVMSPKFFPGMASSSELTRHLAEQGFKLRVRKKTRTIINQKNAMRQTNSDPLSLVSGPLDSTDDVASLGKRKRVPKDPSPSNEASIGISRSEIGLSLPQTQADFAGAQTQKVWSAGPRDNLACLPSLRTLPTPLAPTQDRPKMEIRPGELVQHRDSNLSARASPRPSSSSSCHGYSPNSAPFSTLRQCPPRLHHYPFSPFLEPSRDLSRVSKARQSTSEQPQSKLSPWPTSFLASRSCPSPSLTSCLSSTNSSSVATDSIPTSSSHSLAHQPSLDYFNQQPASHRLPSSSDLLALTCPTESGGSPAKARDKESSVRVYSRRDIPDVWDKLAF